MAWKQVRNFDINKMGRKVGYCQQNVRLGFGIGSKYASAKLDMEAQRRAGTLHDISSLPNNVAVPIFVDTNSPYEHVIVSDHGVLYSDGKRLTSLKGLKCFGWAEKINDVRVVEWVNEPKRKSNEEIADEVMRGLWKDQPERQKLLEKAGYNYEEIRAIVNRKAQAGQATYHRYTVQRGDTLSGIAQKFGTTYQKIAKDNGIANPSRIFPGQVLRINK